MIPPPNVTGNLHMGHALNNTLQDILCRYWRMNGRDVLWQPGVDHAGIATQMVVERMLMERQEPDRRTLGPRGVPRAGLGVEGGIRAERSWRNSKRLGASCDWSRERFTLDEGLSRAVAKVFVQLYREGLVYKDKRLVNWDPDASDPRSPDLEVVAGRDQGLVPVVSRGRRAARRGGARQGLAEKSERTSVLLRVSRRGLRWRGDRRTRDRRDHAARDDAWRHRRRGASGRRALPAFDRAAGPSAARRRA